MMGASDKAVSPLLVAFVLINWMATSRAEEVQSLTLSLAAPITIKATPSANDRNPTLTGGVRSKDGSTVLLVSDGPYAELLVGADQKGFGTSAPLSIKAYQLKIAEGAGGAFWIGGTKDAVVTIESVRRSHGYLAKVDRGGGLLWERDYGEQSERSIQSMSPLASGDVVVSGKDSNRTWLARISSEGAVVWERFVGLGKGSAVATQDGMIALAAIDSCHCDGNYREDVAVWSFDQAGEMVGKRIIREGINSNQRDSAARIEIERANDSIYVLTVWMAYQAQPLEVAKLNFEKGLVWRRSFPKTAWRRENFSFADLPARGLLANGDIVFATREQMATADFVFSRLNAASGDLSEVTVRMPPSPPPSCVERWGPIRFLQEEPDGKMLFFGSPPSGRGPNSCGWIGEAVLPNRH